MGEDEERSVELEEIELRKLLQSDDLQCLIRLSTKVLAPVSTQRPFGEMASAGYSELLHSDDPARLWVSQVGYASTNSSFGCAGPTCGDATYHTDMARG